MEEDVRLSAKGLRVLKLLLEEPQRGQSGAEISRAASVGSGTLYPMLARWENARWVSSEWEAVDPSKVGRPRRRFYKLTALGQQRGRQAFLDLQIGPQVLAWI